MGDCWGKHVDIQEREGSEWVGNKSEYGGRGGCDLNALDTYMELIKF